MPRPSKNITPGSLTDPVPAARSKVWRKHAGPEHASQYEPDGTVLVDALTQETVAEIDLTDVDRPKVTVLPVERVVEEAEPVVKEAEPVVNLVWTSDRSIEARVYHRSDALVPEEA